MQSLTVVGRENDLLIVVNEFGERFSITIDQALVDQVRRNPALGRPNRRHVGPKDIQAHIRRGLTAQQVADLTGEDLDYVERFEGPVLAEREFVVEQARHMAVDTDSGDDTRTFGDLVMSKLAELSARSVSWSAWKEDSGWRVEVTFLEGDVEHRAQWNFDQRKHTLTPLNDDAGVLSQSEPIRGPLIPKLRAVPTATAEEDGERFDSEILGAMPLEHTGPLLEPVPYGRSTDQATFLDEEDDDAPNANTADLLEVLRRRRGEREPAPDHDESSRSAHPSTGSIRLINTDAEDHEGASIHSLPGSDTRSSDLDDDPVPEPKPASPKKNRPEMPSWDDIVFGTRSDDDPA
jgi:hypothetical protein